jgi:hypothetical protein
MGVCSHSGRADRAKRTRWGPSSRPERRRRRRGPLRPRRFPDAVGPGPGPPAPGVSSPRCGYGPPLPTRAATPPARGRNARAVATSPVAPPGSHPRPPAGCVSPVMPPRTRSGRTGRRSRLAQRGHGPAVAHTAGVRVLSRWPPWVWPRSPRLWRPWPRSGDLPTLHHGLCSVGCSERTLSVMGRNPCSRSASLGAYCGAV